MIKTRIKFANKRITALLVPLESGGSGVKVSTTCFPGDEYIIWIVKGHSIGAVIIPSANISALYKESIVGKPGDKGIPGAEAAAYSR